MCYSTAFDRDLKALEHAYHRRMREESRRALMQRGEVDEATDPDRSILFQRTSAFARPFWPVISTAQPDVIDMYRWGFVPEHLRTEVEAKAYLKQYPSFNAVSEDLRTKRTFQEAWRKGQRCLIPVTAFFEWQHVPVPGRKTPDKVPFRIHTNDDVFSLGGLWTDTALGYRAYTVLTTHAGPLMARIHNTKQRQPVIIPKDMEALWLNAELPLDEVERMCAPVPDDNLNAVAA